MSLKTMHLVFLAASLALTAVTASWSLAAYRESGGGTYIAGIAASGIGAGGLFAYTVYFLRKVGVPR